MTSPSAIYYDFLMKVRNVNPPEVEVCQDRGASRGTPASLGSSSSPLESPV